MRPYEAWQEVIEAESELTKESITSEILGGVAGYQSAKKIKKGEKKHGDRKAYARALARHPVAGSLLLPGGLGYTVGRAAAGDDIFDTSKMKSLKKKIEKKKKDK